MTRLHQPSQAATQRKKPRQNPVKLALMPNRFSPVAASALACIRMFDANKKAFIHWQGKKS